MARAAPLGLLVVGGLIGYALSGSPSQQTTPAVRTAPLASVNSIPPLEQPPSATQRPLASPAVSGVVAPRPAPQPQLAEPALDRPLPVRRTLHVRGRDVPLRDRPSREALTLEGLRDGLEVGELQRREGWVQVRHPVTATQGWVESRYVRDRPEDKPAEVRPKSDGTLTAAAIAKLLIAQSLASYPGNCACPYNSDRAGRSCGRRSAHSRGGGRAPLCYESDVTAEMIEGFRQRRAGG